MAETPRKEGRAKAEPGLTPAAALKYAWTLWFIAVVICGAGAGASIVVGFPTAEQADAPVAAIAFSMAIFVVLIAAAFLVHWYCFRRFWKDGVVQPHGFLLAYALLWAGITLTIAILSVVSMTQVLFMPGIMLIFAAVLLLLLTWPSGWAMVHHRPHREEDDEEALKMPEHPEED